MAKGARTLIDTNPDNPNHPIKTDYIDKDGQRLKNGQLNIKFFHFTLWDNTHLDPEYIESLESATPSGMFYDRDIRGLWVAPQGVVYPDFTEDLYLTPQDITHMQFTKYFAGVDWGYEHYGAIVVLGVCGDKVVLLEEVAEQHREIEWWVERAKDIKERYGNLTFYCDTEAPEKILKFKHSGLRTVNADKTVISGIEQVARRFKAKTLFINSNVKRFRNEIVTYQWNEKTGEPIRLHDDVLSALRYGIYTHFNEKRLITGNLRI